MLQRNRLSVHRQRIYLVQNAELAVKKRFPRKNVVTGIGTFVYQLFDKLLRAFLGIDVFLKIPRIDFFIRPYYPRIRGFRIQRTHIIRYSESENRDNLLFNAYALAVLRAQEFKIVFRIVEDLSQLLQVKLIRDNAVFASLQLREEIVVLYLSENIAVSVRDFKPRQLFQKIFTEFLALAGIFSRASWLLPLYAA